MTTFASSIARRPMVLRVFSAAELMTAIPVTITPDMPIQKAFALLKHYGLDAAPVVDESGRLAGVITAAACAAWEEFTLRSSPHGFRSEDLDWTPAFEIASSSVDSVHLNATTGQAIGALLEGQTDRVYVVNDDDEPVGVVTTAEVLRHLMAGTIGSRTSAAAGSLLC